MTRQEAQVLAILKKALKHYRRSFRIPLYRHFVNTTEGFCVYFRKMHMFGLWTITSTFPELKEIAKEHNSYHEYVNTRYWFRPSNLKPRMEVLEQTIYQIEKEYES